MHNISTILKIDSGAQNELRILSVKKKAIKHNDWISRFANNGLMYWIPDF